MHPESYLGERSKRQLVPAWRHSGWYVGAMLMGLGVYLSAHVRVGAWGVWLAASLFFSLFVAYTLAAQVGAPQHARHRVVAVILGYAAVLLGGAAMLLGGWAAGSRAWHRSESRLGSVRQSLAVVTLGSPRGYLREGFVHAVRHDSLTQPVGQWVVLAPDWGDAALDGLPYGTRCLVQLDSVRDGSWRNPHTFDYRRWLRLHGFVAQVRVRRGSVQRIDSVPPASVPLSVALRQTMMERLAAHVADSLALGLMQAMTYGERAALPAQVQASFRQSGLSHILALSGLHVGFLYGFLFLASRFIRSDRLGLRALRYGLPLAGVWLFTAMVGASPSLLRAALMLSAMALHRTMLRRGSGLQALAAAACVTLAIDPLMLWDAGFQLSFSALGGILFFYRPLHSLLRPRWRGLRWLWATVCVTLAAQVGTLPIALALFGTFPLFSILANVVAVPLATLLMPGALLLSALPAGGIAGQGLAYALQLLARLLVASADLIASLPYAQLGGLTLHASEALLLGFALVLLACRVYLRARWLVLAGLMAIIPLGALTLRGVQRAGEVSIVVLHRHGKSSMAVREGLDIRTLHDTIDRRDRQLFSSDAAYMPLHSLKAGVRDAAQVMHLPSGVRLAYAGKRVLWVSGRGAEMLEDEELARERELLDVLIPGRLPMAQFQRLVTVLQPAMVLMDGSSNVWDGAQYRAFCDRIGVPFYSTYEQGYWELVLPRPG